MACYLSVVPDADGLECEGCAREIEAFLVAWTDEIDARRLVPVCPVFLRSLDLTLAGVQRLVTDAAKLAPAVCSPGDPAGT